MHPTRVVRIKHSHRRAWRRAFWVVVFVLRVNQLYSSRKSTRITNEEADELRRRFRAYCAEYGTVTPVKVGTFFRYAGVAVGDEPALRHAVATVAAELERAVNREEGLRKLALNITQVLKVAQQLKREFAASAVSEEELAFEAVREQAAAAALAASSASSSMMSTTGFSADPSFMRSAGQLGRRGSSLGLARSGSNMAAAAQSLFMPAKERIVADSEVGDCLTSFGVSPLVTANDAVPASMPFDKFQKLFFQGGASRAAKRLHMQQIRRKRAAVGFVDDDFADFVFTPGRPGAQAQAQLQQQQQQQQQQRQNDSGELEMAHSSDTTSARSAVYPAPADAVITTQQAQQQQPPTRSGPAAEYNTLLLDTDDEEDEDADDDDNSGRGRAGGRGGIVGPHFSPDASALGARSVCTTLATLLGGPAEEPQAGAGRRRQNKAEARPESERDEFARRLRELRVKMELPPGLELDPAPMSVSREMQGWRDAPELRKMTAAKNRFEADAEVGRGTGLRVLPTAIGAKMISEAAKFRAATSKTSDDAVFNARSDNMKRFVSTPPPRRSEASLAGAYRRTPEEELMHAEYIASKKQQQREYGVQPHNRSRMGQLRVRRELDANGQIVVVGAGEDDEDADGGQRRRKPRWLEDRQRRSVPFMSRPIPRSDVSKQLREALPSKSPAELCRPPAFLLSLEQRAAIGAKMSQEQGHLGHALSQMAVQQAVHADARMAASVALNHLEIRAHQMGGTGASSPSAILAPQPAWAMSGAQYGLPPRPSSVLA